MEQPIANNLSATSYLKDFAGLVMEKKLNDFISLYLMNLYSFDLPMMRFISVTASEKAMEMTKDAAAKILDGIKNGTAIEIVRENLINWRENKLLISREIISLKDITLIYSAQKISLQSFLPYYTSDVSTACCVINELESYYKQVQELAIETLEMIRLEEQQKRQESEDQYRDLFDSSTDLIQIVSIEGNIIYANKAWKKTLGYQNAEIIGINVFDLVKESELQYFKAYRKKIIAGELINEELKTVLLKKNGEEVWVEGTMSCKYKNGEPEYIRATFYDITSRLQQEKQISFYLEQLAAREEALSDIIENAPDGVIVVDDDFNIIIWNTKAEQIFGWRREEVSGKKMMDIILPGHIQKRNEKDLKNYLLTREPATLNKTVEVRAMHKNGYSFYISLTVSYSKYGSTNSFIAFLRDITEQKKNELELENKRKQLERSNKELEQYAWLTSHDLKEPLRKILTFSDALIKKPDIAATEQTYSFLKKIHSCAHRMSKLIDAVLLYSNVASDQHLFKPTNLNYILDEVLEDLEIMIVAKKAKVDFSHLPTVEAIPIQMRQLFQNLISNAIKYSKTTEAPMINISCQEDKEGYNISVSDNGIGFENIYSEKVFQVFQRLFNNKNHEGTGIGLALCKKIAEAHKGSILAQSEAGVGSTFIVYLPAKQTGLTLH